MGRALARAIAVSVLLATPVPLAAQLPDIFNQDGRRPAEVAALDQRIADLRRRIAALEAQQPVTITALTGPREVRNRFRDLREHAETVRRARVPPEPGADTAPARAFATFRARWEDLAESIWTGRPPNVPVDAERWAGLATGLDLPECRTLGPVRQSVRLAGLRWACVSDAFLRELVELEGAVERIAARPPPETTAALDAALREAERGLEPQGMPAPTPVARGVWLREMTWRLRDLELEASRFELIEIERGRAAAAGPMSPYGWFLAWSRRTTSAPPSLRAPLILVAAPDTTVDVAAGGGTSAIRVEAAPPADVPALFARALYNVHDQTRRVPQDFASAIEGELREYEAELEARYLGTPVSALDDVQTMRLIREAVGDRRQFLETARDRNLTTMRDRLREARRQAMAGLERQR